jgi:tape measure domain-containing protein
MALDLGTLSGKIALDTSDFEKSVASAKATLNGWAKDADKTAAATGKSVSDGMGKGAEQAAQRTSKATDTAKAAYDKAAKAAEEASQRQDSAARKVDVAETRLSETRQKYAAGSSQVKAAEDRLISARQQSTRADEQAAEAKKKATKASEEVAKAAVSEAEAQKKTGTAADQAAAKGSGAMSRLKASISSLSRRSNPFQAFPSQAKTAGDESGARFGSGFQSSAKSGLASFGSMFKASFLGNAASSALTSGIGAIKSGLESGFGRLESIDQATAKLTGLGNSANTTKTILNNALASVKGTAYGMGDAATVAASMTASGIKPGQDLEKTLSLVADTATIAGRSITDIGAIFGSVAAKGKLQGDDLLQLTSSGVPVLQFLSQTMHKTTAEVSDMSSKGKISFADFQKAMEVGLGGSAKSSGDTFSGAMANAKAALGRLTADVMGGAFKQMPGTFKGITAQIDAMAPAAERAGAKVSSGIGSAFTTIKGLFNLMAKGDYTASLGKSLGIEEDSPIVGTLLSLRQTFIDFGSSVKTAVQGVVSAFGPMAAEAAKLAGGAALGALSVVMKILTPLFNALGNSLKAHPVLWRTVAASILGAVVALKALSVATSIASGIGGIVKSIGGAVTAFKKGSTVITSFNRAFHALGIAFRLNPIGLVVTAIGLLVAGFIYAYTHSERFRNIVNGALNGVKNAALAVGRWFSGPFVNFFKSAWGGIKAGFSAIGGFFTGIWNGIKAVFTGGVNAVKGVWSTLWTALTNSWGFKALQSIFSVYFRLIKLVFTNFINGVKIVWNGLWTALKFVASGFMTSLRTIISAGMWVVRNVIMPPINAIKAVWSAAWGWISSKVSAIFGAIHHNVSVKILQVQMVITRVMNVIKAVWNAGFEKVKSIASSAMSSVKSGINRVLGGIEGAFSGALRWIERVWGGLQNITKKPISFVLKTVINGGLIKGFNWVANKLGAKTMPNVPIPRGFREGGPTGSMGVNDIAGVVHGQEFVMDAETTRRAGGPGAMEAIRTAVNDGARVPGFKGGGYTGGRGRLTALASNRVTAAARSLGWMFQLAQQGWNAANGLSGTSHAGDAVDVSGPAGGTRLWSIRDALRRQNWAAWVRGPKQGFSWHVHAVPGPGAGTGRGSATYQWGDYLKGGAGLRGVGNPDPYAKPSGSGGSWLGQIGSAVASMFGKFSTPMDWIKDRMKGLVSGAGSVLKKVGNNPFTQMVAKVPGKLLSMAVDKIKNLFGRSAATGTSGNMESWRPLIRQALARTGIGSGKADEDAWLRQVMSESSGNPNALQGVKDINSGGNEALGLLQVIPGTFAAYRDKTLPNDRRNPLANAVAAMRYASSRYGNWRSVIGHGHGYKDGTLSVIRNMFAPLSEDGRPEIVAGPQMGNLMKGSRVYNGDQTEKILRLRTIAQPKKAVTPTAMTGAAITMPDTLIVKDVDDKLVGRMRVEGYGSAVDAIEDRESMMARIGA